MDDEPKSAREMAQELFGIIAIAIGVMVEQLPKNAMQKAIGKATGATFDEFGIELTQMAYQASMDRLAVKKK